MTTTVTVTSGIRDNVDEVPQVATYADATSAAAAFLTACSSMGIAYDLDQVETTAQVQSVFDGSITGFSVAEHYKGECKFVEVAETGATLRYTL